MSNRPEQEFQLGAIKVSVFANEGDDGRVFRTTHANRAYQDSESGEWRYTDSFAPRDLPVLIYLLQQALDYVHQVEQQERLDRRFRRHRRRQQPDTPTSEE